MRGWRRWNFPGSARPPRARAFGWIECAAAVSPACTARKADANIETGALWERRMSQETARRVLRIEAEAIEGMAGRLDATFDRAVETLLACKGRVVVTGMGKSGLIGRKMAAT